MSDIPPEVRALIKHAVAVLASVNPTAFGRNQAGIVVDADSLRDLADAIEELVPGEVTRRRARRERAQAQD